MRKSQSFAGVQQPQVNSICVNVKILYPKLLFLIKYSDNINQYNYHVKYIYHSLKMCAKIISNYFQYNNHL